MPQQIEQNANNALGALLRRMLPRYNVLYENTQQIVNRPGLRPDVLITATGRSPVVVEAEYMPAYTAETEAKDRLGLEVAGTARHIDAAIALRYPTGVKDAYYIDADPNRVLLDRRVICDLLNFDQDTYQAVRRLSAKWCAEPSVHGAKKRPPGATMVI